MGADEFNQLLDRNWRKCMVDTCLITAVITFIIELVTFGLNFITGSIISNITQYICIRIILPTIVDIFVVIGVFAVNKSRLSDSYKNNAICMGLFLMCTTLTIVHNYFHVLMVTPAICMYLNCVYSRLVGLKRFFAISNLVIVVDIIVGLVENRFEPGYVLLSGMCLFALEIVFYEIAKIINAYQEEQIYYVEKMYKKQLETMEELNIEPMTGLYNRAAYENIIKKCIRERKRKHYDSYIVMIDLDFFKSINDTYGHINGDEVIMRFVKLIKGVVDNNIIGFRYGGEEFVLLFKNSFYEQVFSTVDTLREDMSNEKFDFDSERKVTISGGIARYDSNMTPEQWLDMADKALYEAKKQGRNLIVGKMSESGI